MEDYATQAIHNLDKTGAPITASEAKKLVSVHNKPNTLNYSLMIRKLFEYIRSAAGRGDTCLNFEVPSYVPGGIVCDPILLARQLKRKLISPELGFSVTRSDNVLTIKWEN